MSASARGIDHAPSELVQRLLWNRRVGGRPRALPVVVLLGPCGSGKTTVLKKISGHCGGGVVHATVDFDWISAQGAAEARGATVYALIRAVDGLSRTWKGRSSPRFHRFTLSLLAAQVDLHGTRPEDRREKMRGLIDELTKSARGDRVVKLVGDLADAAKSLNILPDPTVPIVKGVLPGLVRAIARRPLRRAARWIAQRPEAENALPMDALVQLNQRVRDEPALLAEALADAFLSDVCENHARMAGADESASCECTPGDGAGSGRHWHNWVLLLDNIDQEAGREFAAVLLAARERLRRDRSVNDPLLIVATGGRWMDDFDEAWLPVWQQPEDGEHGQRPLPALRSADYAAWAEAVGRPTVPAKPGYSPYLPVTLEPLRSEEIGAILHSDHELTWRFVERATGGLPGAVLEVAPLVRRDRVRPSERGVLTGEKPGPDPAAVGDLGVLPDNGIAAQWRSRLAALLGAVDNNVDYFIDAAPFATAPWLMPDRAPSRIGQARVGPILTELRTGLWVTVPKEAGGTRRYAVLHPWMAGALTMALSRRAQSTHQPSYRSQYEALLEENAADPARAAYCRLALSTHPNEIAEIAAQFARSFDGTHHGEWIRQLKLATRAPARFPRRLTSWQLYLHLAGSSAGLETRDARIEAAVRRLLTAEWLESDPFAVPDHENRGTIRDEYTALAGLSQRADVRELRAEARRAADWWR